MLKPTHSGRELATRDQRVSGEVQEFIWKGGKGTCKEFWLFRSFKWLKSPQRPRLGAVPAAGPTVVNHHPSITPTLKSGFQGFEGQLR
jgi:hypothetical protein